MRPNANTKIEIFCGILFCDRKRHGASKDSTPASDMSDLPHNESSSVLSDASAKTSRVRAPLPAWIKVTAFAAGSALAGGLAAAWIYRKTLANLQNAVETPETSNFGSDEAGKTDED
jgi:hypothetical protein